ncbi:hypothetical membrane protein [Corynebacterium kutscheri]|uniref:Hypothetical membrane protein n=1 Tax=Corynebacterium kutscheri TaxID=35755 RepID=A0A0F6QZ14_9CORY|nr:hypothetical protein [Corynebacterium kutscheri]AKE40460.1 hypothetical protein UL82_01140 [Corynebacterium kutscheri]VEH05164.1 hypothetical membrane protein [Corynebacterium kutscheri]VEH10854.1 hypothetical membrane protein [Corynebacterium kutscheri]VEH80669.1 hypothetical membrane protein [Corynebacterium kutscheri]
MAGTTVDNKGYPVFSGRMEYIDGYDPVSLYAPHSSLQRMSTWLGMGMILTSLAGLGTFVFGLGSGLVGTQEHYLAYTIGGAVAAAILIIGGFALIYRGRRYYRQYRAETGRVN